MIDYPSFLSFEARLDFWTILVGMVCSTACSLLGCYLVLRRMSLLGDAISHAILPGLAIAYLLTGSLGAGPMLLAGLVFGVLTAFLTQTLHEWGDVPEDSSMGVVYTVLFAIGVVLISRMPNVHLDTDCVLFGVLSTAPIDIDRIAGWDYPVVLNTLVPALLGTIVFVTMFWKELKITSFDPKLATVMGLSGGIVHYLLMGMVATVTVASLEAVGAILVIAMLVVPAATAHLLTDRLRSMLLWAVLIGWGAAIAGCLIAGATSTNPAGMMAVVLGIEFTVALVFAPQYGLLTKLVNQLRLAVRIVAEDVIAFVYRAEEQGQPSQTQPHRSTVLRAIGHPLLGRLAIPWLSRNGEIALSETGSLMLTERGRERGRSLIRSHRLWESYLDQHFDLPADHLHEPAEQIEHYIGPELQDQIDRELASPDADPHGREIPSE